MLAPGSPVWAIVPNPVQPDLSEYLADSDLAPAGRSRGTVGPECWFRPLTATVVSDEPVSIMSSSCSREIRLLFSPHLGDEDDFRTVKFQADP
ncbi:hypothetical protein BASA61_008393 [Batrachochytrium salamandrivorans]|nr:hypothetical protein BASA61_008393 [Batrachochytrium salamandrivorans]KAH9269497.1 hypothetical protein BASA83_008447 [Batrachochytrium salamandrivorans]